LPSSALKIKLSLGSWEGIAISVLTLKSQCLSRSFFLRKASFCSSKALAAYGE
jgi:hypothetical protein